MVAVIIADLMLILFGFLRPIFHLEDAELGVFSGCTTPLDSKKTKLSSSNQKTSLSAVKNAGVVLVPSRPWKCVSTVNFRWYEYFQDP